jgi:hypothetical protein
LKASLSLLLLLLELLGLRRRRRREMRGRGGRRGRRGGERGRIGRRMVKRRCGKEGSGRRRPPCMSPGMALVRVW